MLDAPRDLGVYGKVQSSGDLMISCDPQHYFESMRACLGSEKAKLWESLTEAKYSQWMPSVVNALLKKDVFKRYERVLAPSVREKERKAQLPGAGGWGKGGWERVDMTLV